MSTRCVKWADVKAIARAFDTRSDAEREIGEADARERMAAYLNDLARRSEHGWALG